MPSHLQMMCRAKEGFELANIIRDFKKFTSKEIIRKIKEEPESRKEWMLERFSKTCQHLKREQEYKVWQTGYHAEVVSSNKFIYQKLDYIHNNPVEEKIIEQSWEYLFSSARNYAGLESVLNIEVLPHETKN